jgi:hypothetical protein
MNKLLVLTTSDFIKISNIRSKNVQSTQTSHDSHNVFGVMVVLFTKRTGALGRTGKFRFEISLLS